MTELLTVRELAQYLKLNPATVTRKTARGEIPAIKIGRQFRFHKEQIDKWLSQQALGRSIHILVIDDEPIIGQFFKDSLSKKGYQVTATTSGTEALELFATNRFDLIFLDLVMPGLDGCELFQCIRKLDEHVPITIITGYPDGELLTRVMEQGPFLVLKKPLNTNNIRKTVRSLVGSIEPAADKQQAKITNHDEK